MKTLEAIERVGRKVASSLDLDTILASVVDATVQLCTADEGSLLLLDESTGELYIRAEHNFQKDIITTFRLPMSDPLVAQVLRSGKPLLVNENTPRKIQSSFFVYSLLCVPLMVQDHAIGMLAVDNRQSGKHFDSEQITMLMALGDYAAIAIETAKFFHRIQELTITDDVTELNNSRFLYQALDREITSPHRARRPFQPCPRSSKSNPAR